MDTDDTPAYAKVVSTSRRQEDDQHDDIMREADRTDDTATEPVDKDAGSGNVSAPGPENADASQRDETGPTVANPDQTTPPVLVTKPEWDAALESLKKALQEGSCWRDSQVRGIFWRLKLLSWWKVIVNKEETGEDINWTTWKEKLISELPNSTLNLPPSAVEQMMDDLRELDNATRPVRVLVLKLTKPLAEPDAEMGEVSKGEDTRPVHEDSPSPAVLSADAKSPFIDLEKWHSALEEIRAHMVRIDSRWSDDVIRDIFRRLQLSDWWREIKTVEDDKGDIRWPAWKFRMLDRWGTDLPKWWPKFFNWMVNDLEDLHRETAEAKKFLVLSVIRNASRDVEMTGVNVPAAPNPSPAPFLNTFAVKQEDRPSNPVSIPPPQDPDPSKQVNESATIDTISGRVNELESLTQKRTRILRQSLADLEQEVYRDTNTRNELDWRLAEAKEEDEKGSCGKRWYRKARCKLPTHRYPTRYSEAQTDEVVNFGRKEYGPIEEKIKKMTARIQINQAEADRIRDELAKAEALETKIASLSSAFQLFRSSQVSVNMGFIMEQGRLRNLLDTDVQNRLDGYARNISDLYSRYDVLNGIALALLNQGKAPPSASVPQVPSVSSQNPFSNPSSTNPFNVSTPTPKTAAV